ncbi:OLC1v1018445C1 [Oldenlandia corymbosa var. corymbosa]|uniref:Glycosyltransferase family 92 protein n=1 Tax=Oldenlandia corymbosa var. corymbosa TaxID=529605 RepID=A0AAV1EBW1_OLDCO|nr:OLC1v1018445C1 [Oldenlandia corymbosa var. corymbosa]
MEGGKRKGLMMISMTRKPPSTIGSSSSGYINQAIHEENLAPQRIPPFQPSSNIEDDHGVVAEVPVPSVDSPPPPRPWLESVSILLPDWEVLVIVLPDDTARMMSYNDAGDGYHCLFPNNDVSPAKPSGLLSSPARSTFKCLLPNRIRRRLPFPNPVLTKSPDQPSPPPPPVPTEMFRWTYVVYDSITTDDDVVVLAKGINTRQGVNRDPSELKCVFYHSDDDVADGVRTDVTNSMQEVFRCKRPSGLEDERLVKVAVEIIQDNNTKVVPTVAYYNPSLRKLANQGTKEKDQKALLCACTMVFNVAKFLKEWVMYHSKLGVERFVLYDNGSDDDLQNVVAELNRNGYDVTTYFWLWPKAQEAGFSHSAVYLNDSCTWTAYFDVDEFIYSPEWSDSAAPSKLMLHSLLSDGDGDGAPLPKKGAVHIDCREFGPSNQTEHPPTGVTQGYNCRKRGENRHKSIVLLDAIDDSLLNVIHHFNLKPGFVGKKMNVRRMIVNHYKFQAWPEFKAKFRRRVSAYVVDWTKQVNPNSNDRTPGLGFEAVEPPDWPRKFCEVEDDGLKQLTLKWFAVDSASDAGGGFKMAWQ